jgi:hypothetical protein
MFFTLSSIAFVLLRLIRFSLLIGLGYYYRKNSLKRKRQLPREHSPEDREALLNQPQIYVGSFVEYWVKHKYQWPKELSKTNPMESLFARQKALHRTKSSASLNTPSESNSRGAKSSPYDDKNCEILLEAKGSFMGRHESGISSPTRALDRSRRSANNITA